MYCNQWIAFEFQQAKTFAVLKDAFRDVLDFVTRHRTARGDNYTQFLQHLCIVLLNFYTKSFRNDLFVKPPIFECKSINNFDDEICNLGTLCRALGKLCRAFNMNIEQKRYLQFLQIGELGKSFRYCIQMVIIQLSENIKIWHSFRHETHLPRQVCSSFNCYRILTGI